MKKYLEFILISLISVGLTVSFIPVRKMGGFDSGFGCETTDITNMYAGYVEDWKKQISDSFDEAEIKIFNIKPTPDIVGPNEDPEKCICKGSGVIVQGDGHKTVCPYHGSKFGKDVIIKPLIILEE
jgi:hypothetical protein